MKKSISLIIIAIIVSFAAAACSGGFGTDSDNADDLAPPLFGKDTTR